MFARLIATPSFCMGALLAIAANTATGQQRATVHPDFQGNWVNRFATPLERPKELDNRPLLTDQEVAELNKQAKRSFNGIYAYYQIVQTQDYLMFSWRRSTKRGSFRWTAVRICPLRCARAMETRAAIGTATRWSS